MPKALAGKARHDFACIALVPEIQFPRDVDSLLLKSKLENKLFLGLAYSAYSLGRGLFTERTLDTIVVLSRRKKTRIDIVFTATHLFHAGLNSLSFCARRNCEEPRRNGR